MRSPVPPINPESTAEEQPAGGEQEERSLHDILAEAYDEAEAGEAGAEEAGAEGAAEGKTGERDERGRFKAKDPAEEAAAAEAAGEKGKAQSEQQAAAEKAKQPKEGEQPPAELTPEQKAAEAAKAQQLEAPANWPAPDKAMLAQLQKDNPRAAQWLLDRHRAMEADYTRKTQAIGEFRKE